jgi:hypothetical protein
VAVPIYQNEQISSQIFETPIKITESSQKITVFLCIQIVFLIQIGPLKLISGFVKLINNSTKKEYSLNLYTAGKVMRNITTLTKAYTIIIRSFTDIPAGDYTLSIDTGSKNMPIETLKVIEK